MAKPSIAVLGLEVVDQNGTPTPADTQAAKELSDGLRARAKAGTGPYQLAPVSDKELIDQKLLNNCDTEAVNCMSAIGNQLGADILLYGHFEKQGKQYQVSIKLLDVGRKSPLKSSNTMIPVSDASGAALQGWAKKIYANLTGEVAAAATITVEVSNADRGTLLVDGKPKGSFSSGTGTFTGLEGKVRIGVEAEGFRRWEKDITVGEKSQTIPVQLEKAGGEIVTPPPQCTPGVDCPGPGPGPEGGNNARYLWLAVAGAGLAIGGGGGWIWYSNSNVIDDVRREQCAHGFENDCNASRPKAAALDTDYRDNGGFDASNAKGDSAEKKTYYGGVAVFVGGGIAVLGVVKFLTSSSRKSTEHARRGKRVRDNRTFVVTPTMSRDGGGATLRLDW